MTTADYISALRSRREDDADGDRAPSVAQVSQMLVDAGLPAVSAVAEMLAWDGPRMEVLPMFELMSIEEALGARRSALDALEPTWRPGWLPFASFDADVLLVVCDIEGNPILHCAEASGPVVLYERLNECIAAHHLALDAGALVSDPATGILRAEPVGLAAAHREVRHGRGPLDADAALAVWTLVDEIDRTAARWKVSAHLDLVTHLYGEAVRPLIDGLPHDTSGRRLDVLARTPTQDARNAVAEALRKDTAQVVSRLYEVGELGEDIVRMLHQAIRDPTIDGAGRAKIRLLLGPKWESEDVIAALWDRESLRFAAGQAGDRKLTVATDRIYEAMRNGEITPEWALLPLAKLDGDAAYPLLVEHSETWPWYSLAGMVEIGRLDEAANLFHEHPRVAGQALEMLGRAGHRPTIKRIERLIRTPGTDDGFFFGLRDGLWFSSSPEAEETMIRIVRDHGALPPGTSRLVSAFVSMLASRNRREIDPFLPELLEYRDCWEAVAIAAALFRRVDMLDRLRTLRFPDPVDIPNFAQQGLDEWIAALERHA